MLCDSTTRRHGPHQAFIVRRETLVWDASFNSDALRKYRGTIYRFYFTLVPCCLSLFLVAALQYNGDGTP